MGDLVVKDLQHPQVVGDHLPRHDRATTASRVGNASLDAATSRAATARRTISPRLPANRTKRASPRHASRAGSVKCSTTRASHLGGQHVGQRQRQSAERAVELAKELVLQRRPRLDAPGTVTHPRRQLAEHLGPGGDRDAPPGKHQLGHRLQIDGIGLDPTPALDPTLFGDMARVEMARVELQQLPAPRP